MKKIIVACFTVLLWTVANHASAGGVQAGAELFKYHACSGCHGADAKSPVSQVIPSLAGKGKSADELFKRAKTILAGEGSSKESEIMHAAFYSPSQCDDLPTDEDLRQITAWLARI